jgi:hypothetical protein
MTTGTMTTGTMTNASEEHVGSETARTGALLAR